MTMQTQTPWQAPEEYRQVESALEGISVYAPRPETPKPVVIPSFKCPNCGATTRYDVAAGGVACEHCGYSASTRAEQVGRGAREFEFTLETWQQAAKGWGVERREMHCDNCGANLTLPEGALTITCPFCASNRVVVREAQDEALRPRFLIPFKIQPDSNRSRASEWLGRGWFHPNELSRSAVVDRFTGIYLPFWTFDARITANWRAEVGYERQERYYDAGDKTWKTRTVIDWRWENGQVGVNIDDLLIVGSSRLSRVILERLYPFNLNELVAYTPDYLAGWQAQAYDITLPAAWETGKDLMREQAKTACYDDIRSSHVRNFSMVADFGDEVWRYLLLPVYVAAYQFENKTYQVMVNGQTGAIAGQKPVAWWKIWLAIAALLAPGVVIGLISLPLLLAGGIGILPLLVSAVLLIGGGILAVNLYKQAVTSEAA